MAGIAELVQALDEHVPTPERDLTAPFLMPIEGVCTIPGRGTVVTGRIERGVLKLGQEVELVGRGDAAREVVVTGIQEFHRDVPGGAWPATTWACCCAAWVVTRSCVVKR